MACALGDVVPPLTVVFVVELVVVVVVVGEGVVTEVAALLDEDELIDGEEGTVTLGVTGGVTTGVGTETTLAPEGSVTALLSRVTAV